MLKLLRNPLYIYVLGFTLTFFVYTFGWSNIYPNLTGETKIFFTITFILFVILGMLIDKLKYIRKKYSRTKTSLILICFYIVVILYCVEFLYEQDVPLLAKVLGRSGIHYKEFGIPILHGILISFNSFLIAHTFATYMSLKNKRVLRINILLYIPAILIINRSIIVLGILTSLFIYVHFAQRVALWNKIKIGLLAFFGFYIFGIIGNLRSGGDYIYEQSKATEDFIESSIPKEFYWAYLYIASPLANFQNTIDKSSLREYDFIGFIFYENLPIVISKNIGPLLNIEKKDLVRIVPWLTVGTTYAKSFSYIGWYGPYLLFLFNIFVYLSVILFLVPRNSNYYTTTIAILSVVVFLNIFTNMLIVTGISFQLVYCILFAFFERKRFVLRT